jgi:DNA-binding NarL/FixJ family response regulator
VHPLLDEEGLVALRAVLQGAGRGTIPRAELVRFTTELPDGSKATLDLSATEVIGHPIVAMTARDSSGLDLSALTPREQQVARLIGAGLSNKEIARRLLISTATVKDHVHRVLVKTGLPSRSAVAARI